MPQENDVTRSFAEVLAFLDAIFGRRRSNYEEAGGVDSWSTARAGAESDNFSPAFDDAAIAAFVHDFTVQ